MRSFVAFASLLALVAVVASGEEQNQPAVQDPNDLFSSFCDQTVQFVREDLRKIGRALVPPVVQTHFDRLLRARENIRDAVNNPSKIDDYLVKGQEFLAKQLQENPLRPTEIYNSLDKAGEAYRQRVTKLDNKLVEQQKSLGQRLREHPVQPIALAKSVFGSIQEGLQGLHSRTLGAIEDTCSLVASYQQDIRLMFEKARDELVAVDERAGSVTLENLRCPITRHMGSLEGVCEGIKTSEQPLVKSFFRRN